MRYTLASTNSHYDDKHQVVAVIHGLADKWISARGRHRVKSPALPPRDTQEEAQADLDAYASGKGWDAVPQETEYIREVVEPELVDGTSLVTTELDALQKHEAVIENALETTVKTFVDIGNALMAIRDSRLYRDGYATFEEYCRERWEISKPYAIRLICASQVVQVLVPMGNILPSSERQVRPLTTIPMEQVGDVWQEAIETAPRDDEGNPIISGKHVEETVKRWKEADEPYEEATRMNTRMMGGTTIFIPVQPQMAPAADEPGTLCEQFLAVLDWLSRSDEERLNPDCWERSRRRWIPHARRAGE